MRAPGAKSNSDPRVALRSCSSRFPSTLTWKVGRRVPSYAAGRDLGRVAHEHRSDSLPQAAIHLHAAALQTTFLRHASIRSALDFFIYALSTPEFESSALLEPARMIGLVPVATVAWLIPHYLAKSTPQIDRKLIFEEAPKPDDRVAAARGLRQRDFGSAMR